MQKSDGYAGEGNGDIREMIISYQRRVVFVHIQKTGGNMITSLLQQHCSDSRDIMNKHGWALWAQQEMGVEWKGLYSFASVRNPWDRLVSWYSMIENNKGKYRNKLWDYVLNESDSFDSFVRNCTGVIDDEDGKKSFAFNQADYFVDENGEPLVNFVGKYESLTADLEHVFEKIGVANIEVPWSNQSKHQYYSDYYTNETKEIVADRFAKDIALFGYKFNER